MAILFGGCSMGSSYRLPGTDGPGNALINTHTPPMNGETDERGICMPLSANSSLNVDVECILEYVRGEASFDDSEAQSDVPNPWIRLIYSF
jgi:hypothetical protein